MIKKEIYGVTHHWNWIKKLQGDEADNVQQRTYVLIIITSLYEEQETAPSIHIHYKV